jgi:mono/diheme cytochrome c family protein
MVELLEQNRMRRRWALAIVVSLAWATTGCDLPGQPKLADRPVPANQVVDFDPLFQKNCAGCHGANGTLGPAPPLNDAMFLSIVPDDELLNVISKGRPGTPMSAFAHQHGGPLNDAQTEALAKGLKTRWKSTIDPSTPLPPYIATEQTASIQSTQKSEDGAKPFARACAACHGEHGQGTKGAGAINDQTFLGLISDQALRRLIITGRPDLGMPNFADNKARGTDYQPLSPAEIDALVALLGAWRQAPAPVEPVARSESPSQNSIDSKGQNP